jgi:hypothetical protein
MTLFVGGTPFFFLFLIKNTSFLIKITPKTPIFTSKSLKKHPFYIKITQKHPFSHQKPPFSLQKTPFYIKNPILHVKNSLPSSPRLFRTSPRTSTRAESCCGTPVPWTVCGPKKCIFLRFFIYKSVFFLL